MGIFGFGGGYDKPGKGVDKDAPKKKGFFLYWDIVFRKFVKFIQANLFYFISSILYFVLLYLLSVLLIQPQSFMGIGEQFQLEGSSVNETAGAIAFGFRAMFIVAVTMLWGTGPASASFAYINRCFTRGEHAWIMSDGMDKMKENFKQGMIAVIIDFVLLLLGINALMFYYSIYVSTGSVMWMALCYIAALLLLIYTMMHPYLYQIMVTFKCGIGALYKNAILLTLGKLPMNLLLTLVSGGIIFALFTAINPVIALLFSIVLGPCIMRYPMEFYAARVIEKSILRDMQKKTPAPQIEYLDEEDE